MPPFPSSPILTNSPQLQDDEFKAARALPENQYCADCDAPDVEYVSLTFGAFLCPSCAACHAALSGSPLAGVPGRLFNSKVRPIQFVRWSSDNVRIMQVVGNANANKFWEKRLAVMGAAKPTHTTSRYAILAHVHIVSDNVFRACRADRHAYVAAKYVRRSFADDLETAAKQSNQQLNDLLFAAIFANDIARIVQLLGWVADCNLPHPDAQAQGRTALHVAALLGNLNAVELLVAAGANPCVEDRIGKTPLFYAQANEHAYVATRLGNLQMLFQTAQRNVRPTYSAQDINERLSQVRT